MKKFLFLLLLVACGPSSLTSNIDPSINPSDLLSPSGKPLCDGELNSDGQRPFFAPCYCQGSGPIYIHLPPEEPLETWKSAASFWNSIAEQEIVIIDQGQPEASPSLNNVTITYIDSPIWSAGCGVINAQKIDLRETTSEDVIAHEIGHNLGFGHSSDAYCIMFSASGYRSSSSCPLSLVKEYFK